MSITYHVCKYTPTELLTALGGQCALLDEAPENFDLSDQVAHPNLCGFGKSVIQAALAGQVKDLVLVNCCDTIRSAGGWPRRRTRGTSPPSRRTTPAVCWASCPACA